MFTILAVHKALKKRYLAEINLQDSLPPKKRKRKEKKKAFQRPFLSDIVLAFMSGCHLWPEECV
jgi:hypothetical protein